MTQFLYVLLNETKKLGMIRNPGNLQDVPNMYKVGKVYKLLGQSLQCGEKSDQHFNEEQMRSTAITISPLNGTIKCDFKTVRPKKK